MGLSVEKTDNDIFITVGDDGGTDEFGILISNNPTNWGDEKVDVYIDPKDNICVVDCFQDELRKIFSMLKKSASTLTSMEVDVDTIINYISQELIDELDDDPSKEGSNLSENASYLPEKKIDYGIIDTGLEGLKKSIGKKIGGIEKKTTTLGDIAQKIRKLQMQLRQVSAMPQLHKIEKEKNSDLVQHFVRIYDDHLDTIQKQRINENTCNMQKQIIQTIQYMQDNLTEKTPTKTLLRRAKSIKKLGYNWNGPIETFIDILPAIFSYEYRRYISLIDKNTWAKDRLQVQKKSLHNLSSNLREKFFGEKQQKDFTANEEKIGALQITHYDLFVKKQEYKKERNEVITFYLLKKKREEIIKCTNEYKKFTQQSKKKDEKKQGRGTYIMDEGEKIYKRQSKTYREKIHAMNREFETLLQGFGETYGGKNFLQYQRFVQEKNAISSQKYDKIVRQNMKSTARKNIYCCLEEVKIKHNSIITKIATIEKEMSSLLREIRRREQINLNRFSKLENDVLLIAKNGVHPIYTTSLSKEEKEKIRNEIQKLKEVAETTKNTIPYNEQAICNKTKKLIDLLFVYESYKHEIEQEVDTYLQTYEEQYKQEINLINAIKEIKSEIQSKQEKIKNAIIEEEEKDYYEESISNDAIIVETWEEEKQQIEKKRRTTYLLAQDVYIKKYLPRKDKMIKFIEYIKNIPVDFEGKEEFLDNLLAMIVLETPFDENQLPKKQKKGNGFAPCRREGVSGGHRSDRDYNNGIY